MRIGIVAEFNPLHSGHRYLIQKAREVIDDNGGGEVVCVMSEFFTQRGEVAITTGYNRAKEAVRSGCDLVIALPYFGSVAYSDDFAKKSIEILVGAGITHLMFGTENTDLTLFEEVYQKQKSTPKEEYKNLLKKGYSFAKINSTLFGLEGNNPNFTLAYSYYKALRELAPGVELIPLKREGQNLNEENVSRKTHLSATAIRKNIQSSEIDSYLSKDMLKLLRSERILSEEDFFEFIKYKIISLGKSGLATIYDINEGLENRIYEAGLTSLSYADLVDKIVAKRYSKKKVQRVLLHILTNSTKEDYKNYFGTKSFRLLAVSKEKSSLIREINKRGEITLVPNLNSKNSNDFVHDIKVANIYNLVAKGENIFRKSVEIVEEEG